MEVHPHTYTPTPTHPEINGPIISGKFLCCFSLCTAGSSQKTCGSTKQKTGGKKENIHSLVNDLTLDTAQLHSIIDSRNQREVMLDSLMILIRLANNAEQGMDIYYYNSSASRMDFRFNSDDGTLQQLKHAGNLQLIN